MLNNKLTIIFGIIIAAIWAFTLLASGIFHIPLAVYVILSIISVLFAVSLFT